MSNKETIYKNFVSYLIDEGALNPKCTLLKEKITLQVSDPGSRGVQSFLLDVMIQLLRKMSDGDLKTLAGNIVKNYMKETRKINEDLDEVQSCTTEPTELVKKQLTPVAYELKAGGVVTPTEFKLDS